MGSINLSKHINVDDYGLPFVDWELLERTTREATHFLDNVVTVNQYVREIPELREAAERARRIGAGIMGLADALILLGVGYNTNRGRHYASDMMEFVQYHSMGESVEIAKYRGSFGAIKGSIFDGDNLRWEATDDEHQDEITGRPQLPWRSIMEDIVVHGIRNAANTTIAPTGTISTAAGLEGYGCEPIFALGYIRHFKDGDKDVELIYTSPLLDREVDYMISSGMISPDDAIAIKDWAARHGTIQDCPHATTYLKQVFVTSGDISPEDHVLMQAELQKYCSNSISKTINFPSTATEEDVAKVYKMAHGLKCRGLTVYVTGSRDHVVLETAETKAKKQSVQPAQSPKRQRPSKLTGSTYRKSTPVGNAYVTVNSDESNQPFEVFLNVGKAGSEISAVSEALGRLISLALRMPSDTSPQDRLSWVISELQGIGGSRPTGFGPNRVLSLPDGISQSLQDYLSGGSIVDENVSIGYNEPKKMTGDICPECGEASFLNIEGCRKCHQCGYSEC